MSNRFEELVIQAFRDLKEDVKVLDSKVDQSREIHIKNTAVLEEHERRSTASEIRIALLEKKEEERSERFTKVKGFFLYAGMILGGIGAVMYFLVNLTDLLKNLGH